MYKSLKQWQYRKKIVAVNKMEPLLATTGGTKVKSDDNITGDTEKVEEIAPLNTNTEIMDW